MAKHDALAAEIEGAILEQGSLTKEQVMLGWELIEDAYGQLKRALSSKSTVEPGPPRVGGFRAKEQRGRLPEEGGETPLREQWEDEVVRRLVDWFQHKELEDLLGDLAYTVRQSRVARGGDDRRGKKEELATALVVQHGIDLLANPDVRRAISRVSGVPAPDSTTGARCWRNRSRRSLPSGPSARGNPR